MSDYNIKQNQSVAVSGAKARGRAKSRAQETRQSRGLFGLLGAVLLLPFRALAAIGRAAGTALVAILKLPLAIAKGLGKGIAVVAKGLGTALLFVLRLPLAIAKGLGKGVAVVAKGAGKGIAYVAKGVGTALLFVLRLPIAILRLLGKGVVIVAKGIGRVLGLGLKAPVALARGVGIGFAWAGRSLGRGGAAVGRGVWTAIRVVFGGIARAMTAIVGGTGRGIGGLALGVYRAIRAVGLGIGWAFGKLFRGVAVLFRNAGRGVLWLVIAPFRALGWIGLGLFRGVRAAATGTVRGVKAAGAGLAAAIAALFAAILGVLRAVVFGVGRGALGALRAVAGRKRAASGGDDEEESFVDRYCRQAGFAIVFAIVAGGVIGFVQAVRLIDGGSQGLGVALLVALAVAALFGIRLAWCVSRGRCIRLAEVLLQIGTVATLVGLIACTLESMRDYRLYNSSSIVVGAVFLALVIAQVFTFRARLADEG